MKVKAMSFLAGLFAGSVLLTWLQRNGHDSGNFLPTFRQRLPWPWQPGGAWR